MGGDSIGYTQQDAYDTHPEEDKCSQLFFASFSVFQFNSHEIRHQIHFFINYLFKGQITPVQLHE